MFLRLAILLAVFSSFGFAAPIYYLATDQTGAQTQIDVNHTSEWTLTPNTVFDFGGGQLTMKAGSKASAIVTFSLYQGTDATGTLLGSVSLSNAQFCAGIGNCSQFTNHNFTFGAPIALTIGTTYFVTLTSAALDAQNFGYFIKDSTSFIADATGTAIDPEPVDFGDPPAVSEVPEPGSLLLMGLGLAALGWRRKKSQSAK